MKFNEVQNLIDDVIENEFKHEEVKDFDDMKEEQLKELERINTTIKDIANYFKGKLSPEDYDQIILLQDTLTEQKILEEKYYFNRGVRSAFTNLNFLEKYTNVF